MLEYNVPQPETITVPTVLEIPAREVREGDVLTDGTVVLEIARGTKYIRLNGSRLGYTFDELVRVERRVETEDSVAAARAWTTNYFIVKALNSARGNYVAEQEKMAAAFEKNAHGPSSFNYESLLEAQVWWTKVWARVEYLITTRKMTPAEAAAKVKESFTEELTQGYDIRGLSKSTSVMSNVLNEVELEAKVKFLRNPYIW